VADAALARPPAEWLYLSRPAVAKLQLVTHVVLLQHSTKLSGPLFMRPGCHALALGGILPRLVARNHTNRELRHWMSPRQQSMQWVSQIASELMINCLYPCNITGDAPTPRLSPRVRHGSNSAIQARLRITRAIVSPLSAKPLDWAVALHSALLLSRPAWDRLSSMRLWARSGQSPLPIRSLRHLWMPAEWGGGPARVNRSLPVFINAALEQLSGILVAHLNRVLTEQSPRARGSRLVGRIAGNARSPRLLGRNGTNSSAGLEPDLRLNSSAASASTQNIPEESDTKRLTLQARRADWCAATVYGGHCMCGTTPPAKCVLVPPGECQVFKVIKTHGRTLPREAQTKPTTEICDAMPSSTFV